VPLLDAAGARRGDEAAVAAGGTWDGLMARAAGHLARTVLQVAGRGYGLKVAVVVGKGDNGGDGWAAAPRLAAAGAQVRLVAVDGRDVGASPATTAFRAAWLATGAPVRDGVAPLDEVLAWCDVAVDAVLGTGAQGAPRGPAGEAVTALVQAASRGTPVVACDVPSGVGADDGTVAGTAVRATATVTFGARKRGLLLHPGAAHVGRLRVGDLGPGYDPGTSDWAALTVAGARPPGLPADADKRARGVVLAVAGAVGTSGAAALTAGGALRAGAGLVTAAVPEVVRPEVAARVDAGVMVSGLAADDRGVLAGAEDLPDLAGTDVVVAGPGLGHGAGVARAVARLRAEAPRLVLDADALNVHREEPESLADHVGLLVLTPHERELARIGAGQDGPDAWARRVDRVPELAARYDATIVAKGPGTLVAAPDGRVWVCPHGGPTLGSGGTGDVLAGVVAAAIARADDVPLAVARAVWWHAVAGQRAGHGRARRGTATDLLAALPGALDDPDPDRPDPVARA
jgi:ADP-dependent NAD(P)H-hydrate dehydratase / NAD(P)H-hydrate epimerase